MSGACTCPVFVRGARTLCSTMLATVEAGVGPSCVLRMQCWPASSGLREVSCVGKWVANGSNALQLCGQPASKGAPFVRVARSARPSSSEQPRRRGGGGGRRRLVSQRGPRVRAGGGGGAAAANEVRRGCEDSRQGKGGGSRQAGRHAGARPNLGERRTRCFSFCAKCSAGDEKNAPESRKCSQRPAAPAATNNASVDCRWPSMHVYRPQMRQRTRRLPTGRQGPPRGMERARAWGTWAVHGRQMGPTGS